MLSTGNGAWGEEGAVAGVLFQSWYETGGWDLEKPRERWRCTVSISASLAGVSLFIFLEVLSVIESLKRLDAHQGGI